jgi:hypothetical protein
VRIEDQGFAGDAFMKQAVVALLLVVAVLAAQVTQAQELAPAYLALPFSDDFEDEAFTLANWTPQGCPWTVANGIYNCAGASGQSLVGESDWGNYTFTAEMSGTNIIDKIMVFRYIDQTHHYGINLRSSPFNDLVLVKSLPGENPQILRDVPAPNTNGNWYSLRIAASGGHIQVFVDDTLTIDYQDEAAPILFGKVGVAGQLPANAMLSFDNVEVTGLPYPVYVPIIMGAVSSSSH